MILIAEPVHAGEVHLQVNSAFVLMLRELYKDHLIEVCAEQKHTEAIRSRIRGHETGIVFNGFPSYNRSGYWYWPSKIWGEWRRIIKVMLQARKQQPELLVWLCLFPTGQWLLQLLSPLLLPQQRQLVILHGELEYLDQSPPVKRTDRFLGKVLRYALNHPAPATRFIVLGTGIRERLRHQALKAWFQLYALPHPYLYEGAALPREHENPLKICLFGALKKAKNAHLFFELAGRFRQEIAAGRIRFQTIGKIFPDLAHYRNEWVSCYRPDDFLPQEEYETVLRKNDLALFFYEAHQYRFSASGAVHEAIFNGLPVWALSNDYFTDVFNNNALGLCYPSVEAMELALRSWLDSSSDSRFADYEKSRAVFFQENAFLLQARLLHDIVL